MRKLIGYIFVTRTGAYYREEGCGHTDHLACAYVYTAQEIAEYYHDYWGTKHQGRWRQVYD